MSLRPSLTFYNNFYLIKNNQPVYACTCKRIIHTSVSVPIKLSDVCSMSFLFVKSRPLLSLYRFYNVKKSLEKEDVENDQLKHYLYGHFVKIVFLKDFEDRRLCLRNFHLNLSTVCVITSAEHIYVDQSAYQNSAEVSVLNMSKNVSGL